MKYPSTSFKEHLVTKNNRIIIYMTLMIGCIYFIALRLIYPVPSFFIDSFAWVQAAKTGQPVTFRPIGYSKLILFFKLLSSSDFALIAGQYFSNLIVNLLLYFTCTFFFKLKKVFNILLIILLIANPFYLFYSNYVSSDSFFNCLAVLWFILIIWLIYKWSWKLLVCQLIVLTLLFELRYNALFFPAVSTIAMSLSKLSIIEKTIGIVSNYVLIAVIIIFTMFINEDYTGTKTFSAFGGWQLANNALHVVQHEKIDIDAIKDTEVQEFATYIEYYFDTTQLSFPNSSATAVFMWVPNSPLKRYMNIYSGRTNSYFKTWNVLGPLYSDFGKTVILQKPLSYIQHFVLPNTKSYFFPPLETYEAYMDNNDTIASVASEYYNYKTNKVYSHHPYIQTIIFKPMRYIFIVFNCILMISCFYYFFTKQYRKQMLMVHHSILIFISLCIFNFLFIVFLAPSVFRYHIFILTLSYPIVLLLIQELATTLIRKAKRSNHN